MKDSIKRTIRTALQLGAGSIVVQAWDAFHDLGTKQEVALTAIITLALTLAINALEEAGIVEPRLK